MAVKLMNSAMMPREGKYKLRLISRVEFFRFIRAANNMTTLENYIGYPQNLELIAKNTGVHLAPSREQTTVRNGDILLIMRLKYRVTSPKAKGAPVDVDDFEYFEATYSE